MELKLRAWNTKTKDWHKTALPFYGFHPFGECTLICPPRIEDLQHLEIDIFIGRQDIHKTDIYSGDKVKFLDAEYNEHRGIIKFKSCSFYIDCSGYNFYRWMDYSSFEIIGSIHDEK